MRNNPELARKFAVKAINRALEGIKVPTVVHLCFGYAAVVPGSGKPTEYAFLPELADTTAGTISIESAQPKIDLGVLAGSRAEEGDARRTRPRRCHGRDTANGG